MSAEDLIFLTDFCQGKDLHEKQKETGRSNRSLECLRILQKKNNTCNARRKKLQTMAWDITNTWIVVPTPFHEKFGRILLWIFTSRLFSRSICLITIWTGRTLSVCIWEFMNVRGVNIFNRKTQIRHKYSNKRL